MKIPAIRGKIGNTLYYTTNLTFRQINDLVKRVDSELHTSNSLKEAIQRSLTDNYVQIKNYILKRDDHFFDSLVLAVYDGEPKWTEVRYEIENETYYNTGLLELSGEEKIFPVDGQHRVEGIKAALQQNTNIATETISVMLIGHKNTPEGRECSRRIFSTLNRYVKPVRLGDIIALDEDDVVAIVTRELLESYPLFMDSKIEVSNTKSIPTNDKAAFTSLMTLYDCHTALLNAFLLETDNKKYSAKQLNNYLKVRPTEEVITNFTTYLSDFWGFMRQIFPEIETFAQTNSKFAAEEMRSPKTGGNIFFRPIGLLPFVETIAKIKSVKSDLSYENILRHYSNMNRIVSQDPWLKILWNPIKNTMEMRNQSLVKYILLILFDSNLLSQRDKQEMKSKYATIFNITIEEAELRINSLKLKN